MRVPSRAGCSKRRSRGELARARGAARAALAADLELPAAAVDVARALDRAQPARGGPAASRHRARRADALHDGGESWQDHRPGAQPDVHSLAWHPRVAGVGLRGGRWWRRLQQRPWRALAACRRGPRPSLHVVGRRRPGRPRLLVRIGEYRPVRRPRRPRPAGAIYRRRGGEPWQPLNGGLPDPLQAMPYALLATGDRLFAGLADGQIWQSFDQGDHLDPLRAPE